MSASWLPGVRTPVGGDLLCISQIASMRRNAIETEVRKRAQYAYLGPDSGLCRVLGRYKLYVDPSDASLSAHLILDGYWELWITEFIVKTVREGMTVVDVGANLGYFTILLADLVGDTGIVHAFEPNPDVARLIPRSAHINGFSTRVVLHQEAVGDGEAQPYQLLVPENYAGGAALVPLEAGSGGSAVTVRRLDSYEALLDADLIKIDAEGFEPAIWRGMRRIFDRGRSLTVLLEFTAIRYTDPAAFLDEVAAEGFTFGLADADSGIRSVTKQEILARPAAVDQMLVLRR